jgi:hypothetical protein
MSPPGGEGGDWTAKTENCTTNTTTNTTSSVVASMQTEDGWGDVGVLDHYLDDL